MSETEFHTHTIWQAELQFYVFYFYISSYLVGTQRILKWMVASIPKILILLEMQLLFVTITPTYLNFSTFVMALFAGCMILSCIMWMRVNVCRGDLLLM